jgi:hypothetical protein
MSSQNFYRNKLVAACILEGELPYLDLVGSKGTTFINDSVKVSLKVLWIHGLNNAHTANL